MFIITQGFLSTLSITQGYGFSASSTSRLHILQPTSTWVPPSATGATMPSRGNTGVGFPNGWQEGSTSVIIVG